MEKVKWFDSTLKEKVEVFFLILITLPFSLIFIGLMAGHVMTMNREIDEANKREAERKRQQKIREEKRASYLYSKKNKTNK